jgi:ParB family transcriptional regulator, chromosome partitioning protein
VKIKIINIDIDEIDSRDDFFRISSPFDPNKLAQSINTIGLINHPYIISKDNKFSIVSGFRRLSACRLLKLKRIAVKQVDSKTSMIECSKLAISDNIFQRNLNLIEQSRCYALLDSVCKDKKTFYKASSDTGLPENPALITKIIPLCRLPQSIQAGIEKETIPLSIAQLFLEIDEASALLLANLFQELTLGLNKQREIFQMVIEIAKRDDLSLWDLLHNKALVTIMGDDQLDKTKKAFKIRQWLKERRFPKLSGKLKTYRTEIEKLKLGHRVRLTPPAYFEGKNFNLSLNFSNKQDLIDFREVIRRLEENKYLISILD